MTQEAAAPTLREAPTALELFTEYFARNYPGATGPRDPEGRRSDTLIHDPYWHAPSIFRAAEDALRRAALAARPADPVEPLTQTFNLCIDNTITAGTLLSNVAFNVKQQDYLAAGLRKDLERCQREWDVACGNLIRARALATPAEPSSRERWNAENPGELSFHTFDDDATPAEPSVRAPDPGVGHGRRAGQRRTVLRRTP